ncbi:hypothetical protein LOTGIDRAFT_104973 [Lottia gigantea]|uniref:MAM domain-containing protein n=1 Tax=Lottia gigantea TaxID=225164 RepID=V4AB31_LOTGI|nr:hypothetical protein LOTGIDRAFT_104973 [Lottia gigantea]ESO93997.1 hypothetical protein LOTGIDRAFT_104973 [Lottia gigantea]
MLLCFLQTFYPFFAAACDFNKNFCTWSNTKSGDVFDWTRHSGSTSSSDTGPRDDHTNMNLSSYIYIETSSPRKTGDRAILKSERFLSPRGSTCFTFWYHMYGLAIGSLTVSLDIEGLQKFKLWFLSGNQGNSWKKGQILLPVLPTEHFYILIEGVRGGSYTGDIAVDDFVAKDVESCVKIPSTG